MHLFYCPNLTGKNGQLNAGESAHCIRVLRMRKGDSILVTNGKGSLHEVIITRDDPESCWFDVVSEISGKRVPAYSIHIAIAPTKSIHRFEWFMEKSVELGINQITPLICQRSERRQLKTDRFQKLIISTMKQAVITVMPELNEPLYVTDFVESVKNLQVMKFIGHCNDGNRQMLQNVYKKGADSIFLIGPVGDFTPEEVNFAIKEGFIPVTLSSNRLRTETAGLAACHAIHVLNGT